VCEYGIKKTTDELIQKEKRKKYKPGDPTTWDVMGPQWGTPPARIPAWC
jgi:hypothetical protein